MDVTSAATPFIKIVPWTTSFFTFPVLSKISMEEPETFATLLICPGLSFVFWLLIAKDVWKVECDASGVYAKKGRKKLFIPFEKVSAIAIGSILDVRGIVRIPKCSIDYINASGREDSINFYGKSYEIVETSIYHDWRKKKTGIAQESIKRRSRKG